MSGFDPSPYVPASYSELFAAKTTPTPTPSESPQFSMHRIVSDSFDYFRPARRTAGMNMDGFNAALISVVPTSGSPNPTIEVCAWDDFTKQFQPFNPPLVRTGAGNGVAYIFACNVNAAIIWVGIVGGKMASGDSVSILISGYDGYVAQRSDPSNPVLEVAPKDDLSFVEESDETKILGEAFRDTALITDRLEREGFMMARANSDSAALSDELSREGFMMARANSDSADCSDLLSEESDYAPAVEDGSAASDLLASETDYAPAIVDGNTVDDTLASEFFVDASLSDPIGTTDEVDAVKI